MLTRARPRTLARRLRDPHHVRRSTRRGASAGESLVRRVQDPEARASARAVGAGTHRRRRPARGGGRGRVRGCSKAAQAQGHAQAQASARPRPERPPGGPTHVRLRGRRRHEARARRQVRQVFHLQSTPHRRSAFVEWAFEHFTVGVWSSAQAHNAKSLVNHVWGKHRDKLAFVWGQDRCTHVGAMDRAKPNSKPASSRISTSSGPSRATRASDLGTRSCSTTPPTKPR